MTRRQIESFVRRQIVKAIFGPRQLTDTEYEKIKIIAREIAATWVQDTQIVRCTARHDARMLSNQQCDDTE